MARPTVLASYLAAFLYIAHNHWAMYHDRQYNYEGIKILYTMATAIMYD